MERMRVKIDNLWYCKWTQLSFYCLTVLVSQMFSLFILPEKYFYDGNEMFQVALTGVPHRYENFTFAGMIFRPIVLLFGIQDYNIWSLIFGVAFSVFFLIGIFPHLGQLSYIQGFILYSGLFLSNIYCFSIGKELIQLVFYLPAFLMLKNTGHTKAQLITLSICTVIVAITMRSYYFLIVGLFLCFVLLYELSRRLTATQTALIIVAAVFLVAAAAVFLFYRYPRFYIVLFTQHFKINTPRLGSNDATTMFLDLFPINTNPYLLIPDYGVNLIRVLFPIELFRFGVAQIIFAVYQIVVSLQLIFVIRKKSAYPMNRQLAVAFFILAYEMVSALFEPDFGSIAKHGAVFWMMFLIMFGAYDQPAEKISKR